MLSIYKLAFEVSGIYNYLKFTVAKGEK